MTISTHEALASHPISPAATMHLRRSRPHLQLVGRAASIALAVIALGIPNASAAPADGTSSSEKAIKDLQEKRAEIRAKKAKSASNVDALKSSASDVQAALAALESDIEGQNSLLEDSQRAEKAAIAEQKAAEAAEAKAAKELVTLKRQMRKQAIDVFTSTPKDETLELLSANSLADAASRNTMIEVKATNDLDAVEQYRTVQEDLAKARERSTAAASAAAAHKAAVDKRLKDLKAAEAKQREFANAVEGRLDAQLSEAAGLQAIDAKLASELTSQQQTLASQLAAQRAAAQRRSGGTVRPPSGSGAKPPANVNGAGIVSVRGIRVASSIAGSLESMLAAASADGITLSGGGYRDPAGQLAVRRNNCGTSDYAIYQMPASSCHPPTARPGQSMHERGLAIDFTQGGSTLNRSSSGYQWLKGHAAGYGFYNLPSEPWHWSTNGK